MVSGKGRNGLMARAHNCGCQMQSSEHQSHNGNRQLCSALQHEGLSFLPPPQMRGSCCPSLQHTCSRGSGVSLNLCQSLKIEIW